MLHFGMQYKMIRRNIKKHFYFGRNNCENFKISDLKVISTNMYLNWKVSTFYVQSVQGPTDSGTGIPEHNHAFPN